MARPIKKIRNNLIVKMHDKKGMTFRAIGEELGIGSSTVHDAYWKHKVMFG